MNNPFRPITGAPGGLPSIPGQPSLSLMQVSSMKPPQPPLAQAGSSVLPPQPMQRERETKRGFFGKLFGGAKSPAKDVKEGSESATASQAADPTPFTLPSRVTEGNRMIKRHEDLIKSVDEICKTLGKSQVQKVEVSVSDILPPIPAENIAALTHSQVQVTGALEKVAGRLDEAGRRDGHFMDSLTRFDDVLLQVSRVSEKSVTTMDGMKGVFSQVTGSMEAMQNELKMSADRYEALCGKVQETEQKNAETIARLQKRSLTVMALLGVAVIMSVVILVVT